MYLKNFIVTLLFYLFHLIFVFDQTKLVLSNELIEGLCGLTTDELIAHYGYEAEVHQVTTEDGYILKVFRCNSKNSSPDKKRPLLVQHGLLISSDDFCVNTPNEALAYVFADAGYDVWLPNSRGNYYSREHVSKDANMSSSGFWDFSWYEMGIYDHPAVIEYILQQTGVEKLHYIGVSQGTTALMVLLSEKPEYNEKIHVASMLAPVGYVSHVDIVYKLIFSLLPPVPRQRGFEFLPRRRGLNDLINAVCTTEVSLCNTIVTVLFGSSYNQRNDTMMPAFMCYFPSGCSIRQFQHYAQESSLGYFGRLIPGRVNKTKVRSFPLSKISAPITIHYTTADKLADTRDVELLIPKLKNTIYVQRISTPSINHIDLFWGRYSASLVYSKIIDIFKEYQ